MATPLDHAESITVKGGQLLAILNRVSSMGADVPNERDGERIGELLDGLRWDIESLERLWRDWTTQ